MPSVKRTTTTTNGQVGNISSSPSQDLAESKVRTAIAEKLGVPVGKLKASLSTKATQWSDAALGLHEPGQIYATVITPGFRITAQADGAWFSFHTNEQGHIKLASYVPADEAAAMVAEATAVGAKKLGVPAEQVKISALTKHVIPAPMFGFPGTDRTEFNVTASAGDKSITLAGERGKLDTEFGFGLADGFGGGFRSGGGGATWLSGGRF